MALFNYATRDLSAKVVYYGPGLSGKTTNIEMVHKILRPEQKGRLISLPTETDRTLFFDFLPLDLGQIKGFKVRFHLYTVPGQVFYNATRRLVLQGVDGVVFVADSQVDMMSSNVESLKNLRDNLASYGKKLEGLPFVMQYNKRDLRNIASVKELNAHLNDLGVPFFQGIAKNGVGVTETLVAISRLVFTHLRKTLLMPGETLEEEAGEIAEVGKKTVPGEAEPLEEISEIEEIPEVQETPVIEEIPEAPKSPKPPEKIPEPAAAAVAQSVPEEEEAPPVQEIPETTEVPEGVELIVPPREVSPASLPEEFPAEPEEVRGEEPLEEEPASPPEEIPDEIEIEIPERFEEPPPAQVVRPGVSMGVEGDGLTFLKFEDVFVSPEGHAVLPAVFLDAEGNTVRIRIRVSMEEGRE
ncbi:MAG TPA: GTPase domain-containing protein [Candidatus Deferrimicrobiaceae bacterium]|nr:GTPase domain-containing protein [Candidatus Deferrimicrobiaceae bacterium]